MIQKLRLYPGPFIVGSLLAVVLVAGVVVSCLGTFLSTPSANGTCYAKITSGSVTEYLSTNKQYPLKDCAAAARSTGATAISSLPAGLTQVCANSFATVYQTPAQVSSEKALGLNPAELCG